MKKLITAIVFLITFQALGQNLKLDNVLKVKLRNMGTISTEDDQIKGYYYFYDVEKADKKNNNYMLKISDENLREINSITITKPKYTFLIEAEYNGEAFAFLFYDVKAKKVEIVSYDKALKQLGSVEKVLKGGYTPILYNQAINGVETGVQFLVGVKGGKGFLNYGFVETKKYHYSVDLYDNNMKLIWNTIPAPETKEMLFAEASFQTDKYVGSTVVRKKNIMSKDFSYDLLISDIKTGKVVFNKEITDAEYNLSASKITFDEATNNIMVFGEYFNLKDKEAKADALGYFYLMLDQKGNVVQRKLISWVDDIGKYIPVSKSGKMEKNARVFVHDIIRNADGDVFVIGEQYKKTANGVGIAAAALSGGSRNGSLVNLVTLNMVILQFTSKLDIKGIHVFEKDKNVTMMPAGAEYWSPKMLANYGLSLGCFDFCYIQFLKDKSSFIVTFNNYIKEKGEKGQSVLSIVIYTPEKVFTSDKVTLNRNSTQCRVQKGKSGYVNVLEYRKKEKVLDSRLEKINY